NVFEIGIPPLRERGLDILLLAEHFLEDLVRTNGGAAVHLTRRAPDALLAYHWPGNGRELRHVPERATIVCEGPGLGREHPLAGGPGGGARGGEHQSGHARAPGD